MCRTLSGMAEDAKRIALVTGGGGGVGLATARALDREGHRVALLGRRREALERSRRALEFETMALVADVADREAVEEGLATLRAAWGAPTVVVGAAGIAESSPLLPPDDALWERTLRTNATGAWVVATACLPGMREAGGGVIVHVASTAALRGYRYVAAYVASKHALLGLTLALAEDLRDDPIRVHALCPGFLDTPMTERTVARIQETTGLGHEEARGRLASMNACGRLLRPEEVARAILDIVGGRVPNKTVISLE